MSEERKRTRFRFGFIPLGGFQADAGHGRTDLVSVILFLAGDQVLAIDVNHTEGVVDCPTISPLPRPPAGVVGVASVRGRITVVVDLGSDSRQASGTNRSRLILIRGDAQLALLADHVESVVSLEPEKIKRLSRRKSPLEGLAPTCFKHQGRQVPIIDVERLSDV